MMRAQKFCGPLSLPKKEWGTVRFMSEFFKKDRREMMFLKNDPLFFVDPSIVSFKEIKLELE
ncbi:hypothetical protein IQB76_11230 [Leptospira borgpetersenii serovar Hardjo-bovis]|uniref:Uncharacterized protein n=1 Tax=Leptospira borgpetersenii serovar Hardjo-bovis str. Sponselee TaxID=1303729 RepID=M6BRV0_LEPBO|nr:hypothetical protein [Leptospira borgpetersenii]AMX59836.1 hypothetical protein LBK6_16385 [Leptospira borgpetersenii serovar Hardjo]AMX63065.1 hypothetical protein LBK9_16315 [Leptospira borgpetersenii serovar Hardjo]AMX66308.1 hypothetical protein LBK30_16305 [Leptospira borgpetersenii serovar Hardjo]AMX69540.1 hypothetical protein LBHA_16270 [Leptospira borgpetersenii serovar Hardjo]AWV71820.1 hypothetical protein B9T54_17800 [Leptospira borgpetersenii serovar Hardjo-bovis]